MLNDTFKERYEKSHEKELITRIRTLLNDFNIDGLKDVILEMESIREDGIHEKLFEACEKEGLCKNQRYNSRKKSFRVIDEEKIPNTYLFAEAYTTLKRPFQHNLIHISNVYAMYNLIKLIYIMNSGESLNEEETQNVYLNGLDKRITFALNEFDNVKTVSGNETLFLNLEDIKWQSKESKMLFNKLKTIKMHLLYGLNRTIPFNHLFQEEDLFLKYVAACSAVKNNRNVIIPEDIILSYKTYFKLLKTDITKYTSDSSNMFNGAVICENCGGYYLLKKGESPTDLNEECDCGGKLEYIDSIKDIQLKHPIESPELKVIILNIVAGVLLICIPFIITCYIITFLKMDFSKLSVAIIGGPILFTTLIIAKLLSDRFDLKS